MKSKLQKVGLVLLGALAGVLLSLNFSAVAQKEGARSPLPVEELRSFAEVFGAIKSNYVEPVEDKKLISEAINGMLTGLDPHSAYLDRDAYRELQVGTQGEFGGLGIEVGMEDGFVKVVSPIEDTPAFRAGIKSGDLIIKLDETPVKGMSLNDAVKRMRGKPKTPIKLTVLRKGETKPLEFTLMRDVIKVQSVKSKLIEPGYGYLRVVQFQEHSGENLVRHINTLYKDGPLKGLVLDLRNDPGGLLNGAVGISAAFLPPKSVVVTTDGRTEDAKRKYLASTEDYLRGGSDDYLKNLPAAVKTVPMVVLVNGGSASASEIVAGALQDHKRALIMGTQTFGKGSVQTIMPLGNNTAIKLTTARYYTPSGRSIQAKGITPDIVVEEPGIDTRAFLREADLDKHLSNDKDTAAEVSQADARKPATSPRAKTATRADQAHRVRLGQGLSADSGRQHAEGPADHPEELAPSVSRARQTPRFDARAYCARRPMNDDQLLRYSRHILLPEIGIEGQEKLLAAHALVIGAGGLGSPAAMYLASGGVGRITLADGDSVDLTNLQRQILHTTAAVGRAKAYSGKDTLAQLNPGGRSRGDPRAPGRRTPGRSWSRAPTSCSTAPTISPPAMRSTAPASHIASRWSRAPRVRFDGQVSVFDLRQRGRALLQLPVSGRHRSRGNALRGDGRVRAAHRHHRHGAGGRSAEAALRRGRLAQWPPAAARLPRNGVALGQAVQGPGVQGVRRISLAASAPVSATTPSASA